MLAVVLRRRRQHHIHPSDLFLLSLRYMGGGPRTFPGGLNKWQWKRLHEKKARDKQNRLLEQEKQIYQARIRSEIRSCLSPAAADRTDRRTTITHEAMSSKKHLRVLADRFMKEGAEDLWNENDGPVSSSPPWRSPQIARPIDNMKLAADDRGSRDEDERRSCDGRFGLYDSGDSEDDSENEVAGRRGCDGNKDQVMVGGRGAKSDMGRKVSGFVNGNGYYSNIRSRNYSVYRNTDGRLGRNRGSITGDGFVSNRGDVANDRGRGSGAAVGPGNDGKFRRKGRYFRNDSSSSDDELEPEAGDEVGGLRKGSQRWPRLSKSMEGDEEEGMTNRSIVVRRRGSSAALGNYDLKIRKRVPLNFVEEEHDVSQQVRMIRQELCKKKMMADEGRNLKESIYSEKRYTEWGLYTKLYS